MVEVRVHTIGIDAGWSQPLVLLRETGTPGRMMPIWVGEPEAAALVAARRAVPPPRPDTHALIANVLGAFDVRLTGVSITDLRGTVYHAELALDGGVRVDARASDAIGLALRADVPIEVADSVFERAAVAWEDVHERDGHAAGPPDAAQPGPLSESEVERFRRLLDEVSPSDFEPDDPPPPDRPREDRPREDRPRDDRPEED